MELFDSASKSLDYDQKMNTQATEDEDEKLTFKRDENGILWSYDAAGNRVGRIFEHGDDEIADVE